MSLLHVRQIESYLRDTYSAEFWVPSLDDDANLSRLLARYAIDISLGEVADDGSVVIEITDGDGDGGIDAVAVNAVTNLVIVSQSKWRKDGAGSIDLGSVLKFTNGIRSLLDIESTGIATCSDETRKAVRDAMERPGGRLRIVLATTASNDLSAEVRKPIDDLLAILNDVGGAESIAEAHVYTQSTFFNALAKAPREALNLELQILEWGRVNEPVVSYYGRVSGAELAQWYAAHQDSLFAENIRVVLPRSEINDGILRTISEDPELFWCYNNGVTVLTTKIERSLTGSATRDAGYFRLIDASIVNGAQTVSTLGRALQQGKADELSRAYVNVRCIEVPQEDSNLARRITRYANTQNLVSSQDFVFLDEEQHRLAKELRVFGYEYILRSGEQATTSDRSKVIDVRTAAVALACSTDLANAVLAKREVSRLFDRDSGPYSALFNKSVNGLQLLRAVEVVRAVDGALDSEASANDGLRSGVAIHGRRVIAHALLRRIGRAKLGNPDFDFEAALATIPGDSILLLDDFTDAFPANSYPGNFFKNQARCAELLSGEGAVLSG